MGNKYITQNCPVCNELTIWRIVQRYGGQVSKNQPHKPLRRRVMKCQKCQYKTIQGRNQRQRTHVIKFS